MKRRRALPVLLPLAVAAILVPACGGGGGGGGGGGPTGSFTVQMTVPANGQGGGTVSPTQELMIYFSGAAQGGTIPGNITVTANNATVSSSATYVACLSAARVIPQTSWTPGALHTVTVTSSVQSATGTPLTATSFTFTPSNVEVVRPTFTGLDPIPAASIGTTSVTLTWTQATDTPSLQAAISYDVYVSTDGCFDFAEGPVAPGPGAGVGTFTVTNLQSNTLYSFIVRARDEAGNDDGNTTVRTAKTLVRLGNDIYNPIVNVICIACHIPGGQGEHMVLSGGKTVAYNAWVNVPPGDGAGTISLCDMPFWPSGVTLRVAPGDSANSLLWRKLFYDTNSPEICGERMPRLGPYLNPAQVQTFKDWIDQGALDN